MYNTLQDVIDNNPDYEWRPMIIGKTGDTWCVIDSVNKTVQTDFKTHAEAKGFALAEKKRLGL